MTSIDTSGPNAEQIQFWNDEMARRWVAFHTALDTQLASLGQRAMDAALIRSGERVLDIGCGCGATTLELARRVGPSGAATGIDISVPMLTEARRLAAAAGVSNVRYEQADAQTQRFESGSVDLLFSRFGVMFFADPRAAFANLLTALRSGGRLAFVCWRSAPENPWVAVPMMAAMQHIQLPAPPAPDAPGPFAFADADRVRGILADAGFGAIDIVAVDEVLTVGGARDIDHAVTFLLELGPTARALREADPAAVPAVAKAVRAALEPYQTANGVQMAGAIWVVTARRA
jgi:ubiquinone/menaquinone biosynthesis C-methylase UbiE